MHELHSWNAGDIGCGELLIKLRTRLKKLQSGEQLQLTAQDLGAVEDLPSWCNMTGHKLLKSVHPIYLIERK